MSATIYEEIMSTARTVRADMEAIDVDMVLSDGTVLRWEGDSAKTDVGRTTQTTTGRGRSREAVFARHLSSPLTSC